MRRRRTGASGAAHRRRLQRRVGVAHHVGARLRHDAARDRPVAHIMAGRHELDVRPRKDLGLDAVEAGRHVEPGAGAVDLRAGVAAGRHPLARPRVVAAARNIVEVVEGEDDRAAGAGEGVDLGKADDRARPVDVDEVVARQHPDQPAAREPRILDREVDVADDAVAVARLRGDVVGQEFAERCGVEEVDLVAGVGEERVGEAARCDARASDRRARQDRDALPRAFGRTAHCAAFRSWSTRSARLAATSASTAARRLARTLSPAVP